MSRADWSGHDGTATARRYELMARHGVRGVSPSYERLCLGVAGDAEVIARLDTMPRPKRQPNLLLASVRYLGGPVGSYPAFREFVLDSWAEVAATIGAHRTQTNEPRRASTMLPVLAALPQPIALFEVGASAGLCLHPDRYAYAYGDSPVLGSSEVVIDCAISGPVPVPAVLPIIAWRGGLDLNPLDVCDDEDVRWLEALVWPEETDRLELLRAATAVAREHPVEIRQGDLTTDLAAAVAGAPDSATLVVMHSAVLAYLDDEQRRAFRAELDTLGRSVEWLANEAPGVVADVEAPAVGDPFVLTRNGIPVAFANSHGRDLHWLG